MLIKSIVFIDRRVHDHQALIGVLPQGMAWFLLDPGSDGITQMATIAGQFTDLNSIHVVSHGRPGSLLLGSTELTRTSIGDYSESLAQIASSLSSQGDILLYGCNVAEGDEGQALISAISNLAQADVAASVDRTGASILGGDSVLESSTGLIETATLDFSTYSAVLATNTAPTFLIGTGKLKSAVGTFPETARDVAIQADGKFVVVTSTNHGPSLGVLRYNADGTLDSTFSGDGKALFGGGRASAVALQSDGKIVVAGDSGGISMIINRYNTDGSIDGTFNAASPSLGLLRDVVLQNDGKILVSGTSNGEFAVLRLNTNGTLDTTFDIDGKVTTNLSTASDTANGIVLQADGKIVVAGSNGTGAGSDFAVMRYGTNGVLDTTFDGDGIILFNVAADDVANSVALQNDGKIVVAGYTNGSGTFNEDFAVVRFNVDGSVDTTFDGDGKVFVNFASNDRANSVVIQNDGKILLAGSWDGGFSDIALARLNTDGTLDNTFSGDGRANFTFNNPGTTFGAAEFAYSVKLLADGKILVVGDTNTNTANGDTDVAIARLNSDGSLDTTFSNDGKVTTDIGGTTDIAENLVIQTDGKLVVAGQAGGQLAVTRYNPDGTFDTTFSGDGKVFGETSSVVRGLTLQADGKIVVAYNSSSASTDFSVLRLNSNGSVDTTFSTAFGTDFSDPGDVILQGDGKIVVAGTSLNDYAVARFNIDGSIDTTFDADGRTTTNVAGLASGDDGAGVAVQANGKILVAGTSFGGAFSEDFAVVRYNSNGSLDTTFSGDGIASVSFGGRDFVTSIALQGDGKAVVGGYTNAANGSNDFALIRLNTDGNLDTTFDGDGRVTTNFGDTDQVNSLVIQSDGKIIAAGSFDGGLSDFAIARYNTNGSLDSTFSFDGQANFTFNNTAFGNAEFATSVKLQADGKIVVVGYTNTDTASGDDDFALVRLNTDGSLDTTFNISVDTLGGNTFFTEKSLTPVALDGTVAVTDAELTGSNYGGATLTLARQGGANVQDVFSATGGALSPLTEGNALLLSGVIIGGVVQNSGGLLSLSFNSNATQARVNQTLSSLGYLNTSNNPSAQVKLDWTFSDGNTGAQGTGGALSTVGTTTVNISLVNDAPTAPATAFTYTNPNSTYTFTLSDFGFADAEDVNLTAIRIDTLPTSGSLRVDGFNLPAANVEFTAANILAGRLTFAPGAGGGSFQYKVKDSGGLFNVALSTMTVQTSGEIWVGTNGDDNHSGTILADSISGIDGNDTLNGGAGSDQLNGGAGADALNGGEDFDFASYVNATTGVTARLDFSSLNTGEAQGDTYTDIEGLIGSQLSDFLLVGDGNGNHITALDGDDYIAGEGGNDSLFGDGGNDQIWGGLGADAINGGEGYDIARYDFAATSIVARLDGGANAGEATGDTYTGIEALYGSGFGDILIGNGGDNVLAGLDGADLLYGLGGNDTLLGGGAADAFAFNTTAFGNDVVLDFATTAAAGSAHDYVDFRGLSLASFAITQSGADALITTNHGSVRLLGINAGTLVEGDFLF